MFLNDSKVVFSLFIILFKFSRFTFCSCDSICFGLFGCAFSCVVLSFSEVCGSFLLGYFCLLILDVFGMFYYLHYLFSDVFLVFQGQKTNLSLLLF